MWKISNSDQNVKMKILCYDQSLKFSPEQTGENILLKMGKKHDALRHSWIHSFPSHTADYQVSLCSGVFKYMSLGVHL